MVHRDIAADSQEKLFPIHPQPRLYVNHHTLRPQTLMMLIMASAYKTRPQENKTENTNTQNKYTNQTSAHNICCPAPTEPAHTPSPQTTSPTQTAAPAILIKAHTRYPSSLGHHPPSMPIH